mmetsp:Transcript_28367/g.28664  ORF Transcript_28367/g.28664 Transcript_28367/m.28664 type:complete len:285 (-) Transcript_28367:83-937(-)
MSEQKSLLTDLDEGWSVFAMIFLAEFGDRTFFVAMMLAAKFNAWAVYTGCMLGLLVCTGLSVFVGYGCTKFLNRHILDAISAAIFLSYAALTFWELRNAGGSAEDMLEDAKEDVDRMLNNASTKLDSGPNVSNYSSIEEANNKVSELSSNENESSGVDSAHKRERAPSHHSVNSNQSHHTPHSQWAATFVFLGVLWTVALSEFLGEVGDRTSIAVILLTTSYAWQEVYLFAMVAFAIVTAIAIVAGAICAKYLSERVVGITSGTAFLVFGLISLYEAITGKKIL